MVYPHLAKNQLKIHYQLIKQKYGLVIHETSSLIPTNNNTNTNLNYEKDGWAGVYIEQGIHDKPTVLVYALMPNYQKLATAYHEVGHHLCYQNNCYCGNRPAIGEAHADKFTLQILLDNQFYSILLDYMLDLCIRVNDWTGLYHTGAKQLQTFAIWGKIQHTLLQELKTHRKTHSCPNQILRNLAITKFLKKFHRTKQR